ncbi:MAG: hypothetical protein CL862_12355 [Cyanobium sp. NAT70]|nr:hypothetical protein [Cyanobium sp. NAT70]|tara:strand:- start:726 stop:1016 length:291 start_codon:yes stop_codon:yes gene_type:complete
MSLPAKDLQDLQATLADRLYIQISGWHLYLGDAKLAETLAIECSARIDQGASIAARQSVEAVKVSVAGGASQLPLARLMPPAQLRELEEILETHSR